MPLSLFLRATNGERLPFRSMGFVPVIIVSGVVCAGAAVGVALTPDRF